MYCGYTLRSSKTKERHYLKCASRHVAKDACPGCFVAVGKLEQAVLTELWLRQKIAPGWLLNQPKLFSFTVNNPSAAVKKLFLWQNTPAPGPKLRRSAGNVLFHARVENAAYQLRQGRRLNRSNDYRRRGLFAPPPYPPLNR